MSLLDRLHRAAPTEQELNAIGELEFIRADLAAERAAHPDHHPAPGLLGRMADAGRFQGAGYAADPDTSAELRPDYST